MNKSVSGKEIQSRLFGSRAVFIYALIATIFAPAFLSIGAGGLLIDRMVSAILILINSSWIPAVYLLGAMGLGRIARQWTNTLPTRWVIELGIGLTLTLTLTHALGTLGFLNPISAWIITGIGCVLLASDLKEHFPQLNASIGRTSVTIPGIAFILGCVVVVMMSLNPPGTLWDSEFGSYDALSYHLQLPKEWFEAGHVRPSEHNVYSFLPSYFESAYLHFAYLADSPQSAPSGLSGFLANDARITMSIQLFSAILVIISAIAIRTVCRRAIELFIPDAETNDRFPAMCARVLMVCTPWIAVVGSLAYNEMGVVLLGICALALAIERGSSNTFRSITIAFIVGDACSIKPTALFLLAPSIAVIFLATIPPRQWIKPLILGSIVGLLTLAPWLIRNQLAAGNIVFPMMSSIFGEGHWTPNQHTLYSSAHHFDGSLIDRFKLLIFPDSTGTQHISRFRGFSNLQWALTPWIGFLGCIVLLVQRRTRKLGAIITGAIILPIISWLMLTHLQSRFLIPLTPMLIGAGVLALASLRISKLRTTLIRIISLAACSWTILVAANQSNNNPFTLIDLGTGVFTGEIEIGDAPWTATLNSFAQPNETIYLLGDATPFYIRSPIIYNTVYDRWLIEDAIDTDPNSPDLWTAYLQDQGIDIVVISFSEINRFANSGWLPKSINPDQLSEWINSLPEPIYVWTTENNPNPIRAAFRISP